MRMSRRMIHVKSAVAIICAAILTSLSSCVHIETPAWSHFFKVGEEGWNPEDMLVFEPQSPDSTGFKDPGYDFTLILRSSSRRPVDNLPLAICVEDNNGIIMSDTLMIGASPSDATVSRNTFGVTETTVDLLSDTKVDEGFSITVSPLLNAENSKGLLNVGIEMRESNLRPSSGIEQKSHSKDQ